MDLPGVRARMTRRWALRATVAGTLAIAMAYASAFMGGGTRWGPWLMVVGLATLVVSLMALGAARREGGLGPLRLPMAFTFVVIVGGFGAALAMSGNAGAPEAGARLLLGLPLRAAIVVYGVGLVPMLVLPLAYALTFDRMTLTEADLDRVRAMRKELGR